MRTPNRISGMSMVELMVAMAIALIGTIIIFQVFEASEGVRRTTTSGGDAQQNGVLAMYLMEKDLRNAGMGFNDTGSGAGCTAVGNDSTRAPTTFNFLISPVAITGGATAKAPDSVSIFYGSQFTVANSTQLSAPMGSGTSDLKVTADGGRYGYRRGDMLLLFEPGSVPLKCELMEVTDLPSIIGQTDVVKHQSTTYNLDWLAGNPAVTSRYNPAGGSVKTFLGTGDNATRVFNIGNPYDPKTGAYNINGATTPVYNVYAIDAATSALTVQSLFSSAAATPVADNIVHMRALYGMDDGINNNTVPFATVFVAGDGLIDRFLDAAAFDAVVGTDKYKYIAAVRIVLVARSALAEKGTGGAGSACDATSQYPFWTGTPWIASAGFRTELDLSADANWECYRYKVFETTIPLRNWLWKSS